MIRVACVQRERPNVGSGFRIKLGVREPLAVRRKRVWKHAALAARKAFRGLGTIRADPKDSTLARIVGDVLAIRTPNREIVAWNACETNEVVSIQIQAPQPGIARKQGDCQM